jgi:hypothetical protein
MGKNVDQRPHSNKVSPLQASTLSLQVFKVLKGVVRAGHEMKSILERILPDELTRSHQVSNL